MGWARGSELAEVVWDLVRDYISIGSRPRIARRFIDHFEDMDCDTIDECETLCADAEHFFEDEI